MTYFTKRNILNEWNSIHIMLQQSIPGLDNSIIEISYCLLLALKTKALALYGYEFANSLKISESSLRKVDIVHEYFLNL